MASPERCTITLPTPHTFLVDNGSLAPAATLRLRELAAALEERLRTAVAPVSLLHSSGVPTAELGGVPAEIFEPAVDRRARQGAREFLVVPLFFGPSRALTEYLPERVRVLRARYPNLSVRLAPALFQMSDDRLARVLADHVGAVSAAKRVVLIDHGSPVPEVTEVRDVLARQLRRALGPTIEVTGACMERRPEPDYDFNGPLLEDLLSSEGWNRGDVTIAMQFLLPGRHAGPEGDVAAICRRAEAKHLGLRTRLTPLVGEHPLMPEILADRWRVGRDSPPL